jgi:hypothetical protein
MPLEIGTEVKPSMDGYANDSRLCFGDLWGIIIAYGVGDYHFMKVLIHGQKKAKWFPAKYWQRRFNRD